MLNAEQVDASRADTGYSLILAGAGTGKTTTLVEKVCNVISSGLVQPEQVLLLTFSRAAAEEMRTRIQEKTSVSGISAGTFHSTALTLLKEYPEQWRSCGKYSALPHIADETERNIILKGIITEHKNCFLGLPVESVMRLYSHTARKRASCFTGYSLIESALSMVDTHFDTYKKEHSLADFDDLIKDFSLLLETDPAVRKNIQERFKYIFIDEFQDITSATLTMVRLMLPDDSGNVCAVGDDAQAIYSFMGSTPEYIRSFSKLFPGAECFKLTQNYRSHYEIVSLSNDIIARNSSLVRKRLHAVKGRGGTVQYHPVHHLEGEYRLINELVRHSLNEDLSTTVLFRNNWQIDSFMNVAYPENESASLLTVHSAKGLEFDTVIIAGIRDGIFPFYSSEIEEERRLFYVALTRARRHLHLIYYSENGIPAVFASECFSRSPLKIAESIFTLDKLRTVLFSHIKGAFL